MSATLAAGLLAQSVLEQSVLAQSVVATAAEGEEAWTPGVLGFLVTLGLVVACIPIFRSMTGKIRGVQHRGIEGSAGEWPKSSGKYASRGSASRPLWRSHSWPSR